MRAAMSTWKFGYVSIIAPTQARSSALQPACTAMKVVAGCAATMASSAAIKRSNRGYLGSQNDRSGRASSSSMRSLRWSTGSKKAGTLACVTVVCGSLRRQ